LKKNARRHLTAHPARTFAIDAATVDSGDSVSMPAIVAGAFERVNIRLRARMLGHLLASVGPLALTMVGGGVFAKYAAQARWPLIPVSFADAARATSAHVHELVRYVQQSNPQLLGQLVDALARDTATIAALAASVAALTINRLSAEASRRRDAR
jgi:hypothetical protein